MRKWWCLITGTTCGSQFYGGGLLKQCVAVWVTVKLLIIFICQQIYIHTQPLIKQLISFRQHSHWRSGSMFSEAFFLSESHMIRSIQLMSGYKYQVKGRTCWLSTRQVINKRKVSFEGREASVALRSTINNDFIEILRRETKQNLLDWKQKCFLHDTKTGSCCLV